MRDWVLKKDMNFDGVFTISDIWLFIKSLYFYPGDYFIQYLLNTDFGLFFEFTSNNYGGFTSGLVSLLAWIFIISFPFGMVEPVREKLNEFSQDSKND